MKFVLKKEFKQVLFREGNFSAFVTLSAVLNVIGAIGHFVILGEMPNGLFCTLMVTISIFIFLCYMAAEVEIMEYQKENNTYKKNMQN